MLQPIEAYEACPYTECTPADIETTNKVNEVIANIAEALKKQGSRYSKLYQTVREGEQPSGLYKILADSDQPAELRPGLDFRCFHYDNPARLVVSGMWPAHWYTTPATYQPSNIVKVFHGNIDTITISSTREPKKLAKEITRRFLPEYELKHEEQLYLMSKFVANLEANKGLSKAIAAEFPMDNKTDHEGSTKAWDRNGKHDIEIMSSPYNQQIHMTISGLTMEQVRQVRALLQHF